MITTDKTVALKTVKLPESFSRISWSLLIIGIILTLLSFAVNPKHASFGLIMTLAFVASVGIGSLFWVGIEYVSSAVWSTALRRPFEFIAGVIPFLIVIAIPLLLKMHTVFEWTRKSLLKTDPALVIKAPYLNEPFFIVRTLVVFGIWWLFYYLIIKNSKLQDTTRDPKLTARNVRLSAAFMPIFGITLTIFSIDWMMSLTPDWFSTVFGVYFFSGAVLAAMAFATLLIVKLNERNLFPVKLTADHYYNLGAFLFAFVNFWAYIGFSQFMLQWYGNLTVETAWYIPRMHGSWAVISIALVLVHFIIPFFALLTKPAKMNPHRLVFMSVWILFAHALDIYWIVMPVYDPGGATFGLSELAFLIASAGIILTVFSYKAKSNNLVPVGDPKLQRGLEFHI
ncbi:MAG: quinol:cytochrome C oxidoreductase [Bacteroidetes bacterium]|nr:quinol:cytochrome C oxidoreductase [Bacteroidota bacterium]MCL5737377.1 quinol:cytochrome C oxidoreductase [Bacteroidota bacterium]